MKMSSTSESIRNDENPQPVRHTSELRIDAPHFVGLLPEFSLGPTSHATPSTPELSKVMPPAIPTTDTRERLERQANELGARLEKRCRNLDEREAQLNTRCAEFEREVRTARLWISEKQAELHQREEQIEAEARALSLATARRSEAADAMTAFERDRDDFKKRSEELQAVEQRLRDTQAQLERCRVQLIEKRSEFDHHITEQRKSLENYRAQIESQLTERCTKLERQARTNEQLHVILKRCREEIEQKHRETLQLRLATEELWVQMSDGVPSPAMLESLSKIRTRLADEYRDAEMRIAERKG